MLLFYSCLCFAISVATAFAAADNLFSDGNAQSLSTSLFTSEDLSAQSGNPNPTDLFQSSTELNPTQIGLSLVPAGSRDIFDFNSGGDLLDFNDDSLFSENLLAANDCGLDSSQVQGRVRARGTTCVNPSPGNAASGSSPQNNKPPEPDSEEPEPLAGGDINNWDKTCALNGLENIMVCSSGNPGDDTVQRLPVPNQGFVSLEWSSASTYSKNSLNKKFPNSRDYSTLTLSNSF